MDSRIYIKSLNATEAGESNTNDSYILISKEFDASSFFGLTTGNRMFFNALDPEANVNYELRYEVTLNNKEQRIYKLGAFCRDKGLHAGDTISIEHLMVKNESFFIIRYRKQNNIVLLQKLKGDYLIERNDIGNSLFGTIFQFDYNGQLIELQLTYKYHGKKRDDSPDEFDFYEATVSEDKKMSDIIKDKYIILDFDKMAIIQFAKTTEYRITQQ